MTLKVLKHAAWRLICMYVWSCEMGSAHSPQVQTGMKYHKNKKWHQKEARTFKAHLGDEATKTTQPITKETCRGRWTIRKNENTDDHAVYKKWL